MIPLTVVGGYLGAGKTTLVNHLLRTASGRRLAVLVNDFGELPIDADLIHGERDGVLAIAGGCVCCAIGSDLMAALQKIAALSPDHILLETSGVALPGPVAAAVRLVPGFSIDAVLVMADAETVRARAADRYMGDTITRQLAQADLVLLNKADLAGARELDATREWLRSVAPDAGLLQAVRGEVSAAVILGIDAHSPRGGGFLRAAGDAAARYDSLSLNPEDALDVRALARGLARPELGVLRAKAVLRDMSGETLLLQGVGARYEVGPAHTEPAGLVCIGLKGVLDVDAIRALARTRLASTS